MTLGKSGRKATQFSSAPVEAELTGTWMAPDGEILFMSVQHPGEESVDVNNPTSRAQFCTVYMNEPDKIS